MHSLSWALPHVPLPSADLNLYSFAEVNQNWEDNSFSGFSELLKVRVILRTPKLQWLVYNWCPVNVD